MDDLIVYVLLGVLCLLALLVFRELNGIRGLLLSFYTPSVFVFSDQYDSSGDVTDAHVGEVVVKLDVQAPAFHSVTITAVSFSLSKLDRRRGVIAAIVDPEPDVLGAKSDMRQELDGFLAIGRELGPLEKCSRLVTVRFAKMNRKWTPKAYLMTGDFKVHYFGAGRNLHVEIPGKRFLEFGVNLPHLGSDGLYVWAREWERPDQPNIPGYRLEQDVRSQDTFDKKDYFYPTQNIDWSKGALLKEWEKAHSDWLTYLDGLEDGEIDRISP